jgi:glycosyltransferase involved in cell wall biosynthesis
MLYILPLEPLPERYTIQWRRWFAQALSNRNIANAFIDGASLTSSVESGSVLDAEGTNFYKFSQLQLVCRLFKDGVIKDGDKFFTFDMWHPGLEAIPYMAQLEHKWIEIYGFLHAGSYINGDFAQPMAPWAQHFEAGWFHMCKKVFVGTEYHKREFTTKRLGPMLYNGLGMVPPPCARSVVVTGNPFNVAEVRNSVTDWVEPKDRKNVIVFPHRWDSEKRPALFMNIMGQLWKRRQDFEVLITTSRPTFRSNSPELLALVAQAPFPIRIASGISKETYYQKLASAKVSLQL